MNLDRKIVKEIPYHKTLDWDLVEQWADGIPVFSEDNPHFPEWNASPVIPLEAGSHRVYIKNEADMQSNPTGTFKDRMAWEMTAVYRDYARGLWLKRGEINGGLPAEVPRLTLLSAGNAGTSLAYFFENYLLPPPKILISSSTPQERIAKLQSLYADVYMVDTGRKSLTAQEIKQLTNNEQGIDLTSVRILQPELVFYDWHVHESFGECPDEIYIPYGSGRLMENYLAWQERTMRNDSGNRDPRLKVPVSRVISMDILGAQPEKRDSCADFLATHYNPFTLFDDHDISALVNLAWTGKNTGIYKVREEYIKEAYRTLTEHEIKTSYSGAASLGLFLQRRDEGKIDLRKKSLVVNTGWGI